MVEEIAHKQAATLGRSRQDAKPMQKESPGPAKRLQEGIDYLYDSLTGRKRK
jgi:hypothetical protein